MPSKTKRKYIKYPATPAVFDFRILDDGVEEVDEDGTGLIALEGSAAPLSRGKLGEIIGRPVSSREAKQIRARARRRLEKHGTLTDQDMIHLYNKPLEEWDMEELARGRPRDKNGHFTGRPPAFLKREIHEQATKRFELMVRGEMSVSTISALAVVQSLLEDNSVDAKGKPTVPAGTKLDASKFLIEHLLGKPKQRVESDISVKLQAILGNAMVNPTQDGKYELTQGYVEAESWEDE